MVKGIPIVSMVAGSSFLGSPSRIPKIGWSKPFNGSTMETIGIPLLKGFWEGLAEQGSASDRTGQVRRSSWFWAHGGSCEEYRGHSSSE